MAVVLGCAHRVGLDDAKPASGITRLDNGMLTYSVESRSRGRVTIASIAQDTLLAAAAAINDKELAAFRQHRRDAKAVAFDYVVPFASDLYTKRRAPLVAVSEGKQRRKAEALAMHAAGNSVRYIARKLGIDRRTVQRYIAEG